MKQFIFCFVCFFTITGAKAQMGSAQVIVYAVEKAVVVNGTMDKVWAQMSNLKELPKYANGYVTAVSLGSEGSGGYHEFVLTLKDGSERKGKVQLLNPAGETPGVCVIELAAPFPAGIEGILLVMKTTNGESPNTIKVSWNASIGGTPEAKAKLVKQFEEEFDGYLKGITELFKS
ncbi:hypothetical protein ACX0G9_04650 [Flavitalea flava]